MRMRWLILAGILLLNEMTGLADLANTPVSPQPTNVLSANEREWVAKHPVVRVGITPEWAPFSYFAKHGKPAGIDIELLDLISLRTGLQFQIVTTDSWDETLRLARE